MTGIDRSYCYAYAPNFLVQLGAILKIIFSFIEKVYNQVVGAKFYKKNRSDKAPVFRFIQNLFFFFFKQVA